jgi:hypothetical protein
VAAWKRLQNIKSRIKKGINTEVDLSEAEAHLEAHRKFFEEELKDKAEAHFIQRISDPVTDYEPVTYLAETERESVLRNVIEGLLDEALWELSWIERQNYEVGLTVEDISNHEEKIDLVCEALAGKVKNFIDMFFKRNIGYTGGSTVNEELKKILSEIKKEDAENVVKTVVAMHNVSLKDLNVEETYKEQVANLTKEVEEANKSISTLKDKLDLSEKKYTDFEEKIEAEKKEAQKDVVAAERIKQLNDGGIDFSEARQKSVLARLREMTEEQFVEYKSELEVVKASSATQSDNSSNKSFAAFNIETAADKDVFERYKELAEEM